VPGTPTTEAARELLKLINDARSKDQQCGDTLMKATTALTYNLILDKTATNHAEDILVAGTEGLAAHFSPQGSKYYAAGANAIERAKAEGYPVNDGRVGENGIVGYSNPTNYSSHVNSWLSSSDHCKNMMDPDYKFAGLAIATDEKYKSQNRPYFYVFLVLGAYNPSK
jgi:uncharacterized protein YkwD